MSINRSTDSISRSVRDNYNPNTYSKGVKIPAGMYRGIVVNNEDPAGMGRVRVHVAALYGSVAPDLDVGTNYADQDTFLGAHWCRCLKPTTSGTTQVAGGGQSSYGMDGPRPAKDNEVLVAFAGDSTTGIVIGVFPDINRVGNTAAGPRGGLDADGNFSPAVTETGRDAENLSDGAPEHPMAENLRAQGLDQDRIRGINRSSVGGQASVNGRSGSRGSAPLGITTPAGHHVVLEDGIPDGETRDGISIRIRSAGGAQILMDDTNGLMYFVNRDGTSWFEMNRNGDIDMYCAKSLNIGTPGDINMTAGGSINMQAGRAFNIQSNGATGVKIAAPAGSVDIFAHANMQLQADANGNIRVGGGLRATAGRIDLNGPPALAAQLPTVNELSGNTGTTQSIAPRVPEAEPWNGHLDVSNLDPASREGASGVSESQSYYYRAPTNPAAYDGQNSDTGPFGEVDLEDIDLLNWTSGVDRRVDSNLINLVLEIAQRFGRPLTIVSGYRDPARNTDANGAKRSQHMLGRAVDISGSGLNNQDRLNLIGIASGIGIKGIGVYGGGGMHFDNRDGARAGWGNDYTRNSVPSYAVGAMDRHREGGYPPLAPLSSPAPTVPPNDPASRGLSPSQYAPGDLEISGFSPSAQAEINRLESDPAWKSKMDEMQARHGFSRTQMYEIIQGESGFDPSIKNPRTSATGLFQFTNAAASDLQTSTHAIGRMSPVDQLDVYDRYLTRWNYKPEYHLGVMQAAPAAASAAPNKIIYPRGSAGWRLNEVWRDSQGNITAQSISDYYNRQS